MNLENRTVSHRVEIQGRLVKVSSHMRFRPKPEVVTTRGIIVAFSDKSRKRLLCFFARLRLENTKFITLTYPEKYPSPKIAKNHLKAFFKRLSRKFPKASCVWRMEFQERGAPHFHIIVFNMKFWKKESIQEAWGEIIGYEQPFTRIERISTPRKLTNYVSKYMSKVSDDSTGFNYVPYRADVSSEYIDNEDNGIGRVWGYHKKELLPYEDGTVISIYATNSKLFHDWKRYMKRLTGWKINGWNVGQVNFVDDASNYLEYLLKMIAADDAVEETILEAFLDPNQAVL